MNIRMTIVHLIAPNMERNSSLASSVRFRYDFPYHACVGNGMVMEYRVPLPCYPQLAIIPYQFYENMKLVVFRRIRFLPFPPYSHDAAHYALLK